MKTSNKLLKCIWGVLILSVCIYTEVGKAQLDSSQHWRCTEHRECVVFCPLVAVFHSNRFADTSREFDCTVSSLTANHC